MKLHYIPLALLCVTAFSCDKFRNLANQADPSADIKPDPALQKLVDQTPEGVIFRKDLPFPGKFVVKATNTQELSQRLVQSSAIENQASVVKGTRTTVTRTERDGDHIRYSLIESTFAEPVIDQAKNSKEAKKPVVKQLAPASNPVVFRKVGSVWKADNSEGFRAVSLSQNLSPVFDQILVDYALAPRALWFGKKRFKIGDQLVVSDKSLPMLIAGNAKGSLTLTLKSIEAVKGHPCGVFEVTGNYERKQAPDFEGVLTDEEVAIRSGKLWLSLIHPLVIKEELDTIQSTRTGAQGNAATRGQGSVKVTVTREWKQL